MIIAFLGINSFRQHKRGVENVIDFQAKAYGLHNYYYIHWGDITTSYKYKNFICLSIKSCWYWPLVLNVVLKKISKKGKILIHSHNTLFSIFSTRKTDVITVHDGLYYQIKNEGHKWSALFWIFEHILYLRCRKVHFISDFTKRQSVFGGRKNFVIIPNSSHFEGCSPYANIDENSRNGFILIVRSIEERARFDLLLEVAQSLGNYKFIVAGKGPLLEYYQEMIKRSNILNVTMLGYVDDATLINLYTSCKMVLNIAEYGEGFGLPVIEGYLFDKPVIASNKCAIPEVIISPVFLFENKVESIKSKIISIPDREKFNFRAFYNVNYSNELISRKIRQLFDMKTYNR